MSILLVFFQAFIRFTNLNCAPAIIFSDNAKTFLGSSQWFSNLISFHEFQEKFESCSIKQQMIALYSALFISTWEQRIKMMKTCLYKIIGRNRVDYFTLLILILDVQRALNRPLTYWGSGDQSMEAITLNGFLHPNKSQGLMLKVNREELNCYHAQQETTYTKYGQLKRTFANI